MNKFIFISLLFFSIGVLAQDEMPSVQEQQKKKLEVKQIQIIKSITAILKL